MVKTPVEENYSEHETKARAAVALQRMLVTPHEPHKSTPTREKAK
jgi:hypothetical protein